MGLNIKNQRVHEMARAAAERTGTSQTGAVEAALERYLAELDAQDADHLERRRSAAAEVIDDMRKRLRAAGVPALSTDDLYDDTGMPA